MPEQNKAFEVQQYDAKNWKEHTKIIEKAVPEPKQGEVLVAPYLRPGTTVHGMPPVLPVYHQSIS